jgi:hypothetical protein
MSGADYRESLRRLRPTVFVDGRRVESVADEPALAPGVNALAYTYDFARDPKLAPVALATQASRGHVVNRMLHVNDSAGDLLNKLEAVRLLRQETGCAQRYLAHDALNGLAQVSARIDEAKGSTEYRARFAAYLPRGLGDRRHRRRCGQGRLRRLPAWHTCSLWSCYASHTKFRMAHRRGQQANGACPILSSKCLATLCRLMILPTRRPILSCPFSRLTSTRVLSAPSSTSVACSRLSRSSSLASVTPKSSAGDKQCQRLDAPSLVSGWTTREATMASTGSRSRLGSEAITKARPRRWVLYDLSSSWQAQWRLKPKRFGYSFPCPPSSDSAPIG